jgi:hypothetical protein
MRRPTKKYSGPALQRYLRRFYAAEPGLTPATAEQLARRATAAFSSVHVRKGIAGLPSSASRSSPTAEHAAAATPAHQVAPAPAETGVPAAEFDAYAIGLVPIFQREGRDGLIAKLSTVTSVDNLRKMARAQQIVLPDAMRQEGVAIDVLRGAIADAVGKRIADRRAAAG